MRTLKSTLVVSLLGLTTVVVVGLLAITLFLPALLQRFGCAPYGIRCVVGQANIRPRPNLTVDLIIDHVTLFDPHSRGVALQIKRLAATLDVPSLIRTRQIMPTEVRIENPELLFRRLDDGRWNLLALVQELQQHLQPATRPTPLQLPRTSVANGVVQLDGYRVTDLNVTLEPKPAPILFEMQAGAAASGRTVRASAIVRDTLEGQILAQVREDALSDAEGTMLRAALRFRLDRSDRAVMISDWSLEAKGALARGVADVRYADWPPAYTLTIAQWRTDLGALAQQHALAWLAPLTGVLDGQPTTLRGRWPNLPDGQVTAILQDGGWALPTQQSKITGLTGGVSLQSAESRLRLGATLRGETVELFGQRYDDPSLQASFIVDPATGDVTAEELRASISGARVHITGGGRRWGRDGLDFTTTALKIEPAVLTQLSRWADRGVTIARLVDPSIHVRWPGAGRPWKAEIGSRSIRLYITTMDVWATLLDTEIAVQGFGASERNLEGALAIGQADLAGRRLRALRAGFEIGPDHVRIPSLHVAAGDGEIRGRASLSMTTPLQEAHVALLVRGLRPQELFASTGQPIEARGVRLDAELSVDATFGGYPSAGSGKVMIQNLSLSPVHRKGEPGTPLMRLQSAIPFTLDKGLLTIPKTAVQENGGLTVGLEGALPLGRHNPGAARIHLSVPWTEVSTLHSTITGLTGGRPETTRMTGQLRADLELIGEQYHGTLALRGVGIASDVFRLDGATGAIPLHGRIGSTGSQQVGQGPPAFPDRASSSDRIGRRHFSEQEHRATIEQLSAITANAPISLAISSLVYSPIELRNIGVALTSSEGRIAIQRFAFDAWGGRWSGRGTVEPLGGGIALTVLADGLSLRAICDAFPPIKGYISGRINGMADLSMPRFALNRAEGQARFWTIDSPQEGRKISRVLIEHLAGQQIRYFSLFGLPRRYDRGVLDVALKAGDLIFHELEISHATLGSKDVDVRVSPTFNRIGFAHLLESINEAIERIRVSAKPDH